MKIEVTLDHTFRQIATPTTDLPSALLAARNNLDQRRALLVESPEEEKCKADVGRALKRTTHLLMLSNLLEEALLHGNEAADVWRALGRGKALLLARLELARIHERMGDDTIALETLEALLELTKVHDDMLVYQDFVQETWACFYATRGLYTKAAEHLTLCLRLREERGNTRQIEQTQTLLYNIISLQEETHHA